MTGWRLESIGRDDSIGERAAQNDLAVASDAASDYDDLTATDRMAAPPPKAPRHGGSRIVPVLILLCILVLFAVSAWYVYQRFAGPRGNDVQVIRADTTPITRQPEDPGGLTIPNQDRVVLERGEVDDAVVAGETATSDGTVPITDLPLNIDSSSDVSDAADATGVTAEGTGESIPLVIGGNDGPDTLAVPAGDVEVEALSPPTAGEAVAEAASAAETAVADAATAAADAEPEIPAQPGDASEPLVLIERQADEAADTAGNAASEANDAARAALDAAADAASDAVEIVDGAGEGAAEALEQPTGGARLVDLADPAVITEPPAPTPETVVAQAPEAPAEPAPAADPAPAAEPAPAEPVVQAEPAPLVAPQAAPAGPGAVAAIPGGGYRVQVSSVQSVEGARQSWEALVDAHGSLVSDLSLTIEEATVNGAEYHRVQVGPLDEAGAISLCEQLKTRGQDCFVVRP